MDVLDGLGSDPEDRACWYGRVTQADHRVVRRKMAKWFNIGSCTQAGLLGRCISKMYILFHERVDTYTRQMLSKI